MRGIVLLLLIVIVAGCKSTTGPLASKKRDQKPDPLLNSDEKQSWGRERYSYPENNRNVAPNTFNTYPFER